MSTKKKMIVSITSMCVVLLVAVVSVIAVWAATSASVKSNISITYEVARDLSGTMKMRINNRTNKVDANIKYWQSLKTENGQGSDTLTFGGENVVEGAFSNGYNSFSPQEYTGIHPMIVLEVQMTNTSVVPYNASFTFNPIQNKGTWPITEIYLVRDFFEEGATIVPQVSQYYDNPQNFNKEVIGDGDETFTSTNYQVNNDGTYCFYLCIISDYYKTGDESALSFSISLSNAFDEEA